MLSHAHPWVHPPHFYVSTLVAALFLSAWRASCEPTVSSSSESTPKTLAGLTGAALEGPVRLLLGAPADNWRPYWTPLVPVIIPFCCFMLFAWWRICSTTLNKRTGIQCLRLREELVPPIVGHRNNLFDAMLRIPFKRRPHHVRTAQWTALDAQCAHAHCAWHAWMRQDLWEL